MNTNAKARSYPIEVVESGGERDVRVVLPDRDAVGVDAIGPRRRDVQWAHEEVGVYFHLADYPIGTEIGELWYDPFGTATLDWYSEAAIDSAPEEGRA